jgi:hypothetical protein
MLFRAMTPSDDGLPLVAHSGRALGVRPHTDIKLDAEGRVLPGCGGMSVAPWSMWNVPHHRRPCGMGRGSTGPQADLLFSLASQSVSTVGLVVRPDPSRPAKHAFVEPPVAMELSSYETRLGSTRADWRQVWP